MEFNTLTAVNSYNSLYPIEVYDFLKENGIKFIQFIPIVERRSNSVGLISPHKKGDFEVTDWSVRPNVYGDFLIKIFDEWV